MRHTLKIWPAWYVDVATGLKTFEYRKNDREFEVGDLLILLEYDPTDKGGTYTGRAVARRITYITKGAPIPAGYCILGIEVIA